VIRDPFLIDLRTQYKKPLRGLETVLWTLAFAAMCGICWALVLG